MKNQFRCLNLVVPLLAAVASSELPTLGWLEPRVPSTKGALGWTVGREALERGCAAWDDYKGYFTGYTFFDDDLTTESVVTEKGLVVARFERQSEPVVVVWRDKGSDGAAASVDLSGIAKSVHDPVRVDLKSGRIAPVGDLAATPLGDAPVMIAPRGQLPRRTEWRSMTPAEIVDAIYRPGQTFDMWQGDRAPIKMRVEGEPWTKMKTEDFLPCFDRYGQFKYRTWPGKTASDEDLRAAVAEEAKDLAAHPGPADRDRFGGWTGGPALEATGRFRTQKVDGRWWLVDPEGRLFWSWGAVRVTPSSAITPLNGNPRSPKTGAAMPDRDCLFEGLPAQGEPLARFYSTCDELLRPFYLKRGETRWFDFSSANLYRKYGEDYRAVFADLCHRRLRSWGCNTIANSSDLEICLQDRTPYAERVECLSRPIEGSWGWWFKFRDPFDPSFKDGVRKELEKHGREAHDPWCIGFFIDNEIEWGRKETDLASWTLQSPADQPARIEFLARLGKKGIDPAAVPEEELRAFTGVLVREYFRRTREAVKEFDPKLLYLGCRFARAPSWAIAPAAEFCDVVSYNIYRYEVDGWKLPQGLDAPVMIGEFHFGAHDRGLFGSGLINAGSQEARAKAIVRYVTSALSNPQIVGVHWHQFSDQPTSGRFDGEDFQVGWTDICDRPYAETVSALRSIDIYPLRAQTR